MFISRYELGCYVEPFPPNLAIENSSLYDGLCNNRYKRKQIPKRMTERFAQNDFRLGSPPREGDIDPVGL
jgi:hypothetical protein